MSVRQLTKTSTSLGTTVQRATLLVVGVACSGLVGGVLAAVLGINLDLLGRLGGQATQAVQFSYVLDITGASFRVNTLTLTGTARADRYVGQIEDHYIDVDWGDGSSIETTAITEFPDLIAGTGASKTFTINPWSLAHTYTGAGSYTVRATLYHGNPQGNETSESGTVVIITENTLPFCTDGIDNDHDGLVDDADPDCRAFRPVNTPPVITLTQGNPINIRQFDAWVWIRTAATATDAEDGNLTSKLGVFNRLSTGYIGTYLFSYFVTDSGGLSARAYRAVNVTPFAGGDYDKDGVADVGDNCPFTPNANQLNSDGDSFGDACDRFDMSSEDMDGDGVKNLVDNCPFVANPAQGGSPYGDRCF